MTNKISNSIGGVVLDWAGTMIDYGSLAPAAVFQEVFRLRGVEVTVAEAREPMGRAKRDHIAAVANLSSVAARWQAETGQHPTEADIDQMYAEFLPLQKSVLQNHCELIPGALQTFRWCREHSIGVASTTGYTRDLMQGVLPFAAQAGYTPDVVLCAEDAPQGRPAPWLIFQCAQHIGVYPMHRIVKVDDTVVGIEAGANAGTWNVGIVRSGNLMGMSEDEVSALPAAELEVREARAREQLIDAGAHYTIPTVADLPEAIAGINRRLSCGDRP